MRCTNNHIFVCSHVKLLTLLKNITSDLFYSFTEDGTSQRKSREAVAPADIMEPSPSHSGSPTTTSSSTWKPIEQQPPQPSFSPAGLYSLSPSPSPPSSSLDRLSGTSPSVSGGPTFRLSNAFTPRVVQVHSSGSRLNSKSGETSRLNGTFHKGELTQPKKTESKYTTKPPSLRLDISEFPRIPKIKRESDNIPSNEVNKQLEPSTKSSGAHSSGPIMNQLTGRGDTKQLGRFSTAENTERNTRQESQAHSRNTGGTSSSETASSSNKAPSYSNSSRNIGSSDSGGGGLRITISGSSTNSCRQFSPVSKDPFRTSDGKMPQKASSPYSTTVKKEKNVKNEIYDPFEPTGSDSGSPSSSPERPATPPPPPPPTPPPPSVETTAIKTQSSGVKVGAFRSFKFTSHSSKVSVFKLGPGFSGMSPTNKEPEESISQVNESPIIPSFLKLEKDIKKEIIPEETNELPPFRISCPLGLKITSDLKAGGTRGFHFDVENEHPVVSVKPDPDVLPHRTCLQSTSSNRLVWDAETPHEPTSRTSETKKKITVKEESKEGSSSRLRAHSRERDSRSASMSIEDRERNRKFKSKSHKVKRTRSDRSSSGSCERSKKKRQKERKKDKKRKRSESRERRRSRSSSHSSSSHRAYNSKKKKKKKRDSRSESPGYSISPIPDKERKRKHKSEKGYSSKEGSSRPKEKKKSKDDRGKQRSKSPQVDKEFKVHKSKDKTYFRDTEITRHIVLSPNNNENTITCTVSFKAESPTITQETKKSVLSLPKEEEDEEDSFLFSERKVSIKQESASDMSDHSCDEKIKLEANSPPWSPSLLDSLLPDTKSEDDPEPPSPQDASPVNDFHSDSEIASPQNSPLSVMSDIPSPKLHSPHAGSVEGAVQSAPISPVKQEVDDLQWSPSHLDDLLLNDLSDDVCSIDAASPDDVDLEEAILMKREGDYKVKSIS